MQEFMDYLDRQITAGKGEIATLEAEGRQDDANFAKVRANIYDICKTVSQGHPHRPGAGVEAIAAQLERFETAWGAALEKAREQNDAAGIAVEETKLAALTDVMAHVREATGA